jgi:hypothetical protein
MQHRASHGVGHHEITVVDRTHARGIHRTGGSNPSLQEKTNANAVLLF